MCDGLQLLLVIIFMSVQQYITQLQAQSRCHEGREEQQCLRLWGNFILKDSKYAMDGAECRTDSWERMCPLVSLHEGSVWR